LVALDEFAENM